MSELSQKPVGARVVKAADRDPARVRREQDAVYVHASRPDGGWLDEREALEKILERVLSDLREQRRELSRGLPPARTKTLRAVPAIVNLMHECFTFEHAE